MKKMERKENANRGFSLVELIVVIAIMAVLVGLLAPQFLKYVERSRQSTDKQNVDSIINALEVYSIDEEVAAADKLTGGEKIYLTTTKTAVKTGATIGGDVNVTGNVDKALAAAGIKELQLKSSEWNSKAGNVTLTVNVTDGVLSVTADDASILE